MLVIGLITQLLAIPLLSKHLTPTILIRITSIVLIFSAALAYNNLYPEAIGAGISMYNGLFNVTTVTQGLEILLLLAGSWILLAWGPIIYEKSVTSDTVVPKYLEYPIIVVFTLIGSSFLISSADVVSMYVSIELQSFAVYILAALYRDSESASSAGLKYFLLGALSSALILLGAALIYANTGLTNLNDIYNLASVPSIATDEFNQIIILGIVLISVGFLFKVAAAPFHNWAPDVYDGVPTIVTTWLTVMPKIAIFIFLMQLVSLHPLDMLSTLDPITLQAGKNLLLVTSVLSLVIGTVVGLAQTRIKRLFAYSTVSHVGFLLLALAVSNEDSLEGFLFYIIQYTLTNLDLFLIVLAWGYSINTLRKMSIRGDITFISDLTGLFRSNVGLSMCIAICLFSIAGIPPLMGFFAKYMVLYSSIHSGYFYSSLVAIITSVVSAAYYLRIVRVIYFDQDPDNINSSEQSEDSVTQVHSILIAVLSLTVVAFVLNPSLLLNCTHLMALNLYY